MKSITTLALSIALASFTAACAPQPPAADSAAAMSTTASPSNLMADLTADVSQVQDKLVALAKAVPADKYNWRPAPGVRSVGEVMLHVAADNYLIPGALGAPVDSSTGIKPDDYNTAVAFEKRALSRDSVIAELEKSFVFAKQAMQNTDAAQMGANVSLFGLSFTRQQAWIMATTHLHEHLGQAIAYARSNGVVPPWSK